MRPGQRFFAFIRAINVGKNRLTNDQLMEPFVCLGFDDVAAYQAAGNITFRTSDAPAKKLERIEAALAEAYGFDAPTCVRTLDELRGIVDAMPFTDDELASTDRRVQVGFLREPANPKLIDDVLAIVPAGDRVAFSNCEWFWLPTKDIRDSRLPLSSIEDLLGPMTLRTLRTLDGMLTKFET